MTSAGGTWEEHCRGGLMCDPKEAPKECNQGDETCYEQFLGVDSPRTRAYAMHMAMYNGTGQYSNDFSGFVNFVGDNLTWEAWGGAIQQTKEIGGPVDDLVEFSGIEDATESAMNFQSGNVSGGLQNGVGAVLGKLKIVKKLITKGGAHGKVKEISGNESHHMPADSVSPLSKNKGPAVSMRQADHRKIASWGSSKEAKAYRRKQKELIDSGDFKGAQQMDIKDMRSKFGNKYDDSIKDMQDYTDSLDL